MTIFLRFVGTWTGENLYCSIATQRDFIFWFLLSGNYYQQLFETCPHVTCVYYLAQTKRCPVYAVGWIAMVMR